MQYYNLHCCRIEEKRLNRLLSVVTNSVLQTTSLSYGDKRLNGQLSVVTYKTLHSTLMSYEDKGLNSQLSVVTYAIYIAVI